MLSVLVQGQAQLHNRPHQCQTDLPGHLFRLFVGWVPKSYKEEDLLPLFSPFGRVCDVLIQRDKATEAPKGCAFVSFAEEDEAKAAIAGLDRQIHLPGALCPIEVRFAKSHHFVQAGAGPQDNRQLFFSHAPKQLDEEALFIHFSQWGVVEEINLFQDRKSGQSKGAGFVTMQTRDQALRALDNAGSGDGCSLQVQWADPELQLKKKKALEESNADNRMLFFAKVLRSATEDEVRALFSHYGKVYDVNLFRAFQGAPTTKGCGLITMGTHEEALAAIEALDSKYCWEGMEGPMVVKWMDTALQRRRREQHLAAMRQGLVPTMAMGPGAWLPGGMGLGLAPSSHLGQTMLGSTYGLDPSTVAMGAMGGLETEITETPPAGCAPDAIKLFVGNIPKSCTEEQLLPFFETVGLVVELVIVRDKASHESKGSAFVWYASRANAERAILQLNLRHVLPDPSGQQDRPLVVRKAKSRANKMGNVLTASMVMGGPMGMGGMGPGGGVGGSSSMLLGPSSSSHLHPALALLAQNNSALSLSPVQPFYTGLESAGLGPGSSSSSNRAMVGMGMGAPSMPSLQHLGQQGMEGLSSHAALAMQQSQQGMYGQAGGMPQLQISSAGMQANYRGLQPMGLQPAPQLVGMQRAAAADDGGLYNSYARGQMSDHMSDHWPTPAVVGSGMNASAGSSLEALGQQQLQPLPQQQQQQQQQLALSLTLSQQQLSVINNHLFSIQTMSGAQLHVSPGTPGFYHLLVSGPKGQLENAKNLLSTLLGQAQG